MTDWTPPEWTLGDRIRKVREAANLTIDALAREANVARQSIGPWEAGARTPGAATSAAIVRVIAPRIQAPEDALVAWIRTGQA